METPFVGLLPAAGRATRLSPLRYPKELLPIVYEPRELGGARARAVAEYSVDALARAGVRQILFVVAPWKMDVVTYFGGGGHLDLDIAYLVQEEARGLPQALDLARHWCAGRHTVFAMPDTIAEPADALRELRELYLAERADLALAVFPTAEAHRLGPVLFDARGRVTGVLDKPERPPAHNTWGAAIWNDTFAALLHDTLAARPGGGAEPVLGDVYDLAVRRGLRVVARYFRGGAFRDVGTHLGLLASLSTVPPIATR